MVAKMIQDPRARKYGLTAVLAGVALTGWVAFVGCGRHGHIRPDMRGAYNSVYDLYSYVWAPGKFEDPANRQKIQSLLNDLNQRFHSIENIAPNRRQEPGFAISLQTQRRIIDDARTRFQAGATDYARWRLKGIVSNCVSCHTRFQIPVDFIGARPSMPGEGLEEQLAYGDFLLATRQFTEASNYYLNLAEQFAQHEETRYAVLRALKYWLLVEVRVKGRPAVAREQLATLTASQPLNPGDRATIETWMEELQSLAAAVPSKPLEHAQTLLGDVLTYRTESENVSELPKTLTATAELHKLLDNPQTSSTERREALLLLATAYVRLPIRSLEVFRELYLESCIREFPGTSEARQAFFLYKQVVEETHTGTSGLHLEDDEKAHLDELRKLAAA